MQEIIYNRRPQFRVTLPPEEDLQTYKRSLVRLRNINASGTRINCGKIATLNPKKSPWKNIGLTAITTGTRTWKGIYKEEHKLQTGEGVASVIRLPLLRKRNLIIHVQN